MKGSWTKAEWKEFSSLIHKLSSLDQMDRINAWVDMSKFIERVGKEKCDAMFAAGAGKPHAP